MMRAYRLASLAGISVILCLSACNPATPSQVTAGKMRVKEQAAVITLDAARPDPDRLDVIAKEILRKGRELGVDLTMPYLEGGSKKAAMKQAAEYKEAFAKRGIPLQSVDIVPVPDKKYAGVAILTYRDVAALPAKGCGRLPGLDYADDLEGIDSYKFGCEMQRVTGKMIADPSDLLGKGGGQDDGDSRRAGATVETYRNGTPNGAMGGLSASGN